MNATMIKGERSKLLAVAVIIAMVACALVAFMPTADAEDGPLEAADSYKYEGFEYTGERTIVGNEVLMTYPMAYDVQMLEGMNDDFPRFVGALYRADSGATVKSITYNGVEYTWDAEGTLLGSNWVDADGKTLVKAVDDALGDVTTLVTTGGSVELTLGLSDETTLDMTYTIAAPVASIGTTYYGTLQAAVDAAVDKDTIVLNKGAADENNIIQGDGVKFATKNYTITLDFNELTYDINGTTVGSTGTETNGFQLLKDNNVTLMNGKVISTSPTAWIILQNYCNLTLDDFTVDASETPRITYASSNNNGNVTYSGETYIIASEGNVAFDVCGFSSYPGVTVTIADDFTGTIDGKVEVTYDVTYPSTGTMDLNINKDVVLDTLVVNNGTVTIAEGVKVTANKVAVASDAVLNNNGTIDAIDYSNEGIEVIVEDGVEVAIVGSAETLISLNGSTDYDIIRLGTDITLDQKFSVGTGVTIDLAGNDLTSTNSIGVRSDAYIDVPAGSTLTINKVNFASIPTYDWLKTEPEIEAENPEDNIPASKIVFMNATGETFTVGEEPDKSGYIPSICEGASVVMNNVTYEVFHVRESGGTGIIQYGIGINDMYYKGTPYTYTEILNNNLNVKPITPGYTYSTIALELDEKYDPEGTNPILNAKTYPDAIHITIDLKPVDGGDSTPVAQDVDVIILAKESEAEFNNNGNQGVKVEQSDDQVTVSGDVVWTENGYTITVGMIGPVEGSTILVDGTVVENFDGTLTFNLGNDLTKVDGVTVVFDYDGSVGNYSETEYAINFSNLKASADVTFVPMNEGDDACGLDASELQNNLLFTEDPKNPGTYYVSGDVNWIYDYDGYSTDAYGYFIGFYVELPNGIEWNDVKISVQHGDFSQTWTGTYDGYFVGKVTDSSDVVIKVDLDGNGDIFTEDTYTLKFVGTVDYSGLTYNPYTDYEEDVSGDVDENDETVLAGVSLKDVTDETIYMIFDSLGLTRAPTIYLYEGDVSGTVVADGTGNIYKETLTASGSDAYIWYASFLNQLKGVEKGGLYTIQAVIDGQTVAVDTINVPVVYGAGYDEERTDVIPDMNEQNVPESLIPVQTNIADRTMWIAWYNAQGYENVVAEVYYGTVADANLVYTQDSDEISGWKDVGPHIWYFSFAENEPADIADMFRVGEYIMVITADGIDDPIATATVYIEGTVDTGYESTAEDAEQAMKDAGYTPTDGVADKTMWIIWYNGQTYESPVTVTLKNEAGEVILTYSSDKDGVPEWVNAGQHAWYFSFGADQPAGISDDFAFGKWTMEVTTTVDGLDHVIATGDAYIIDEENYSVTYIDEGWNNGKGYEYDQDVPVNKDFKLPDLPDGSKTAIGWKVLNPETGEYDVYGENTYVDLSKYVDVYNAVTFYAVYGTTTPGEPVISENLDFEIRALATGLQIHIEALDDNILPSGSFDVTFYYYTTQEVPGVGEVQLAVPVVIEDVEFDNTDSQYNATNVNVTIPWSDYLALADDGTDFIAYATYTTTDGTIYDVPIYTFDVSFLG